MNRNVLLLFFMGLSLSACAMDNENIILYYNALNDNFSGSIIEQSDQPAENKQENSFKTQDMAPIPHYLSIGGQIHQAALKKELFFPNTASDIENEFSFASISQNNPQVVTDSNESFSQKNSLPDALDHSSNESSNNNSALPFIYPDKWFFLKKLRALFQKQTPKNIARWSRHKSSLSSPWENSFLTYNAPDDNDWLKGVTFSFAKINNQPYIIFSASQDKMIEIYNRDFNGYEWVKVQDLNRPVTGFNTKIDAFALEKNFTYCDSSNTSRTIRGVFKHEDTLSFGKIHVDMVNIVKAEPTYDHSLYLKADGDNDNMSLTVDEQGKITLCEQKGDDIITRDVTGFFDRNYESKEYHDAQNKTIKGIGIGSFTALLTGLCFWKKEAVTNSFAQAKTFAQPYFSMSAQHFGSFASTQWTNLANRTSALFGWLGKVFSYRNY